MVENDPQMKIRFTVFHERSINELLAFGVVGSFEFLNELNFVREHVLFRNTMNSSGSDARLLRTSSGVCEDVIEHDVILVSRGRPLSFFIPTSRFQIYSKFSAQMLICTRSRQTFEPVMSFDYRETLFRSQGTRVTFESQNHKIINMSYKIKNVLTFAILFRENYTWTCSNKKHTILIHIIVENE